MTSGIIEIDAELKLYYEQAGNGERVILLVPGWTMSTEVFTRQLEYFRDSDEYRCISFDPRAQGRSSKTVLGHDYWQHGRDLQALVAALGLERFVLAGWSFGCLETLAYVNQAGAERLAGLMMLDGPPRAAAADNVSDWATYRFDDGDGSQAFYTLGRLQNPAFCNREFAAWMLEDKSEANIGWLLDITGQTPDIAAVLLNATAVFCDFRADLIALEGRMPLSYVMRDGRGDVVRAWAKANTPSAEVHEFGEHLMFWERADRFNRLLQDFTDRCFGTLSDSA